MAVVEWQTTNVLRTITTVIIKITRMETVLKMLVCSLFNHLIQLVARERFTALSRLDSFKLYVNEKSY